MIRLDLNLRIPADTVEDEFNQSAVIRLTMPIPGLNQNGLLPRGVHDCTLDEIAGSFARNPHRKRLFQNLVACLEQEIRPVFVHPIFVDGSFVTDKDEPEDIDIVLDLKETIRRAEIPGADVHEGEAKSIFSYVQRSLSGQCRRSGISRFILLFSIRWNQDSQNQESGSQTPERHSQDIPMSEWTEAVEAKARIIHGQLAAACAIAERNGASPDDIAQPYLELLRSLYRDEFAFAQLVDTSDLVARFVGPAVSGSDPTVTTVTGVFHTLRNQIRQIAKSIVGLSSDEQVAWPSDLDPHLSGLTHGGCRSRTDIKYYI